MATWDDVRAVAMALPEAAEVTSRDLLQWKTGGKLFAWERPLHKPDLEALGAAAPDGPILGVRVADEGVKHALIADDPAVYFTTPHFNGYPAILIRLGEIPVEELREVITESWLLRAPKRLVRAYEEGTG